ncbi:hypothetical protein F511_04027 [Dorcoceras hygrometricum]|uniref:Uncharacterized protein n=1 Tax=Dorcoceras hygrometricum TaxID=472368 RepID=A0A2Z7BFV0_9LAMI|nr:hypothetical protein F511_04027 [Dorcoceras hygrometricum]
MAASFSVNTLEVYFESVLAMENSGMVGIFKTLENTRLKGFLTATGSLKLALSKEVFGATFGSPTEGMVGFLDVPKETQKKEMKMEYRLLHDIVAKALFAKVGSFDMVTSEKFDLMVSISVGLKADLGESVKLHPQKVLTAGVKGSLQLVAPKSIQTNALGRHSLLLAQKGKREQSSNKMNRWVVMITTQIGEVNPGCDTQMDHEGPDENESNDDQGETEQSTVDGLEGETT